MHRTPDGEYEVKCAAVGHDDNSVVAGVNEVVTLGDVVRSSSLTVGDGRCVWWVWFYIGVGVKPSIDQLSKRNLFLVYHIHCPNLIYFSHRCHHGGNFSPAWSSLLA
jgi:hypothetical protein